LKPATLKLLSGILERLRVRGANGIWAERACLFCQRLPLVRQGECLQVSTREHLEAQQKRLERSLRLREPVPESYADKVSANEGP
jgi:hypothetical protein